MALWRGGEGTSGPLIFLGLALVHKVWTIHRLATCKGAAGGPGVGCHYRGQKNVKVLL
jgi:hypothetical protein